MLTKFSCLRSWFWHSFPHLSPYGLYCYGMFRFDDRDIYYPNSNVLFSGRFGANISKRSLWSSLTVGYLVILRDLYKSYWTSCRSCLYLNLSASSIQKFWIFPLTIHKYSIYLQYLLCFDLSAADLWYHLHFLHTVIPLYFGGSIFLWIWNFLDFTRNF